jgi:hypothetical protein
MPVTPPPPRTSAHLSMTSLVHPSGVSDSRWRGTGGTRRFSRDLVPESAAGHGKRHSAFTPATPLPDEVVRAILRHRIHQIAGPARADAAPRTGHAG